MANANITQVQVTNTFDEWRVATNDLISDRNILRNHPYVKDNSNFRIANGAVTIARSTGGTLLTVEGSGDASIGGTTTTTDLIVTDDGLVGNVLTVAGNTILQSNLSVAKNTVISQNVNVAGTLNVVTRLESVGNAHFYSNAFVSSNTTISQNLIVVGTSNLTNVYISSNVRSHLNASLNVYVGQNLFVYGNTDLSQNLNVTGNTALSQNLNVAGTLNVTGNSIFSNGYFTGTANAEIARLNVAYVNSLTVTDPILAPAVSGDSVYVLRFNTSTDGDGIFRVQRNSGNADIYWNETSNSYQFLMNNQKANVSLKLKSYSDYILEDTNVSGSKTIDLNQSNWFKLTLTGSSGNRQITFNSAPSSGIGYTVSLIILQDGSGSKTPTFANTIYWAGGLVPPATTSASARDLWTFTTYDGGSTYLGTLAVKDAR